jgi:enoyl-CoA hydratase/carnithine racemase
MQMIMTGSPLSADDALQWGLVNEVVQPEELDSAAGKLAKKILEKSPLMIQWVKDTVNLVLDHDLLSGIDKELAQFSKTFNTYDCREGTAAFLEKRKPKFIGK